MTTKAGLGEELRRRRLEAGMTQEELGKLAGYGTGAGVAVSRIENGSAIPPEERLERFASALGCSATVLQQAALPGQARTLKQRRSAVEAAFLNRHETLTELERACSQAEERAVVGMAMKFIDVMQQFINLPRNPAEAPRTSQGSSGQAGRLLLMSEMLSHDLNHDSGQAFHRAAGPIGGLISSGVLQDAGRSGSALVFDFVQAKGVASTGTQIANLRGIAKESATLAWLGFGTTSNGGFGVRGGSVVLAAVAALPTTIAIGGVFALALISNRRELQRKIGEAEVYLHDTSKQYEAIATHLREATEIFDLAATHGAWELEGWSENLVNAGVPVRDWLDLDNGQRARFYALWELSSAVIQLAASDTAALMTAPSERGDTVDIERGAGASVESQQRPRSSLIFDDAVESFEATVRELETTRTSARRTIRSALGRRT